MPNRDVVTIGTSAGGVETLQVLAAGFKPDFPASVLVTIHLPSHHRSSLDQILSRAGPLAASFAVHGEPAAKSHIYLAPPGSHLLLEDNRLVLGSGPRENNARPAIDPMLRSAALCCGGRAIGVVLTGTLGDGASGLWAVRRCGGIAVVQDPHDAPFPEMPRTAIERAEPDHVVPLAQLPALLDRLAREPAGVTLPAPERLHLEISIAKGGASEMSDMDRVGRRSVLTCPDCGGVMWEIPGDGPLRYRCHVGHAYAGEPMALAQDRNLRRALASAVRGYEERAALLQRMAQRAAESGHTRSVETWRRKVA
jgi:two-component system chemotaxis response regulator CheB